MHCRVSFPIPLYPSLHPNIILSPGRYLLFGPSAIMACLVVIPGSVQVAGRKTKECQLNRMPKASKLGKGRERRRVGKCALNNKTKMETRVHLFGIIYRYDMLFARVNVSITATG